MATINRARIRAIGQLTHGRVVQLSRTYQINTCTLPTRFYSNLRPAYRPRNYSGALSATPPRHACRAYSEAAPVAAQQVRPAQQRPPVRYGRILIYTAIFMLIGYNAGRMGRSMLLPDSLPEPGSKGYEALQTRWDAVLDALPLVKQMTSSEEWQEVDAYAVMPAAERNAHLIAGTLDNYGALGCKRSFWNADTKTSATIVYFGGAITGLPTVTHGGAIATMLEECMEQAARLMLQGTNRGGDVSLDDVSFQYRRPSPSQRLYVVEAVVETEGTGAMGLRPGEVSVKATIRDASKGLVTVIATGTCNKNRTPIIVGSIA